MPGVIMMENGVPNGLPTNHNRDMNGAPNGSNGVLGGMKETMDVSMMVDRNQSSWRMNDLPDEIQHITQGYVPLGLLLSRLAQKTHNQLQGKILELAKMPVPMPALNGNSAHSGGLLDDTSVENLAKKASLLKFIQDTHAKWTKALVISAWSRKAPTVSKLIDLMHHTNMQRMKYDESLDYLINVKRDLTFARIPNPDMQTALQILSTGDAPWMPDFNYIEPPPISVEEQMEWIEELNTLLTIRLNVEDHDKIPYHFGDYNIDSGRVTFKVKGEFEVDLTIADEDFEKQYWFIDFRFLFTPAPAELTDDLRFELEVRVNDALAKDGLQGCYNFLHEFVLTHKITEFVRQAMKLEQGAWVDTLKVERLQRAMSIQYWANRVSPEAPKSWVILGVHSGKKAGMAQEPKASSYLTLRWFKDNREVKDVAISVEDVNVSTEELLKRVIARHVEDILSTIHRRLRSTGRFQRRDAALGLSISREEPVESELTMQMGHKGFVTVRISPTTGFFSITPHTTKLVIQAEYRLSMSASDPAEEGLQTLEKLRSTRTQEEMNRHGKSMGWAACKGPVKMDDVKALLHIREAVFPLWFQRNGWPPQWHLLLTLSLSGDRWWLLEVSNHATGPRISTHTQLPLTAGLPALTDQFFSNLTIFTAAVISHVIDLKAVNQRRIHHTSSNMHNRSIPPNMKLPAMVMRLSDLLKSRHSSRSRRVASWANDFVQITFRGIQRPGPLMQRPKPAISGSQNQHHGGPSNSEQPRLVTVVDARFKIADRAKFSLLRGNVERDVAYNARLGVFALRLKSDVGNTILDTLVLRLQAIERLVDCVNAIQRSNADIKCETITLNQVVFTYSDALGRSAGSTAEANIRRWKASLDLRRDRIKMSLEKGNPHLRTLDGFNQLLNSDLGFTNVPQYLAYTLPALKTLDAIEDGWKELMMNNQGIVEIFPDHLDWFNIRYTLPTLNRNQPRRVSLQLSIRKRQDEPWWYLKRHEVGPVEAPDDEFKTILSNSWENTTERVWKSFVNSASCEADDRVCALLKATDAAIRELAFKTSPPAMRQTPVQQPQSQVQAQAQVRNQAKMPAYRSRPQQIHMQQQQQPGNVVVLDD